MVCKLYYPLKLSEALTPPPLVAMQFVEVVRVSGYVAGISISRCFRGAAMTVGIAAICDSGKRVVIASDRMFTHSYPSSVEFETLERKIEQLHPKCAVLQSSNDTPVVTEILELVRLHMQEAQNSSVPALADLVKKTYVEIRLSRIEERIVLPSLGADYVKQRENGVSLPGLSQAPANNVPDVGVANGTA